MWTIQSAGVSGKGSVEFWTQSAEKPANNRKTPGLEIQRKSTEL
jgi:hypothetical protein